MANDDRDKIIDRIRKCLELAKCAGEGEAAAALQAAQRLMENYNITESAVQAAGIGESSVGATVKKTPSTWEASLAGLVAEAFSCSSFFAESLFALAEWRFIGPKTNAEVASYAFSVLFRQLKRARREHIRGLRRCGRERKVIRGDLYCIAWVSAVKEKLDRFASPLVDKEAVDAYVLAKYKAKNALAVTNRVRGNESNLTPHDMLSYHQGLETGEDVSLQHGVGHGEARPQLTGS